MTKLADGLNSSQFEYSVSGLDGMTVAVTPIFTTLAGTENFYVTNVILTLESVTGVASGDGSYSIGFTGPGFNNVVTGENTHAIVANDYSLATMQGLNGMSGIPPATTVSFNLITGDTTAVTYVIGLKILGNYI